MDAFYRHLRPTRPSSAAHLQLRARLINMPTSSLAGVFRRASRCRRGDTQSEREDKEGQEVSGDPKQTVEDLLRLVRRLLINQELRAAVVLLDNLIASDLAEGELQCTRAMFQRRLVNFTSGQGRTLSKDAVDLIHSSCRSDSKVSDQAAMSRDRTPSQIFSRSTSVTTASGRHSSETPTVIPNDVFHSIRQPRRLSKSAPRPDSFSSLLENRDAGEPPHGQTSPYSCEDPYNELTPSSSSRASFDHSYGDASGSEHDAHGQMRHRRLPSGGRSHRRVHAHITDRMHASCPVSVHSTIVETAQHDHEAREQPRDGALRGEDPIHCQGEHPSTCNTNC